MPRPGDHAGGNCSGPGREPAAASTPLRAGRPLPSAGLAWRACSPASGSPAAGSEPVSPPSSPLTLSQRPGPRCAWPGAAMAPPSPRPPSASGTGQPEGGGATAEPRGARPRDKVAALLFALPRRKAETVAAAASAEHDGSPSPPARPSGQPRPADPHSTTRAFWHRARLGMAATAASSEGAGRPRARSPRVHVAGERPLQRRARCARPWRGLKATPKALAGCLVTALPIALWCFGRAPGEAQSCASASVWSTARRSRSSTRTPAVSRARPPGASPG